jgi:hypothetical protein
MTHREARGQGRHGIQVLALATALLLSACSAAPVPPGAAQPSAGPTAALPTPAPASPLAPTAAPTAPPAAAQPTPAPDVAALFARWMASDQLDLAGEITGSMTLGNLIGDITGAMATRGADSAMQMTITIPDVLQTSNYQITVDGHRYESKDGGPFFEVPLQEEDDQFSATLAAAALAAEDRGIETRDGQQLHHLVPSTGSGVTAADLGMTDPSMANASGTLDFYARDDGSLAVLAVTLSWTMASGGQSIPASMELDFTFRPDDIAVIGRPDSVWTTFTSKEHGYSIGYPDDMRLIASTKAADPDVFAYSPTELATVMRERQPKAAAGNLGAYTRAFIAATPCKLEVNEKAFLAGRQARVLACHEKINGEKLYLVWTLLIEGRNAYQVGSVGPAGSEDDVRAFNEAQVSTFTLP